jgi:hypothetical protein
MYGFTFNRVFHRTAKPELKNKLKCKTKGGRRGGAVSASRPSSPPAVGLSMFLTVPVWLFMGIPYSKEIGNGAIYP